MKHALLACALALVFVASALAADAPKVGQGHAPPAGTATVAPNAPLSGLADLFASDFTAAETLATATSIQDGNGQACWAAFKPFGDVIQAHPDAFTGKLATDLEAQRLTVIAARNLCDNSACRAVFEDLADATSSIQSSLPITIGINVTPVNLFSQACAHIPSIKVVAPTPVASPVSAPK